MQIDIWYQLHFIQLLVQEQTSVYKYIYSIYNNTSDTGNDKNGQIILGLCLHLEAILLQCFCISVNPAQVFLKIQSGILS